MRNKMVAAFVCALCIGAFSGCGSNHDQEALELRNKGMEQMEAGEYESAVSEFDQALKQGKISDDVKRDILCYKGAAQSKTNEFEMAVETYSAIENIDKDGEALYLRGVANLEAGKEKEALKDFKNAIGQDGKEYERCFDIYLLLEEKGLEKDGQTYLQHVLDNCKDKNDLGYLRRGKAYYYLGDYKNAETELEVSKEKGSSYAVMYLGLIKEKAEDYEGAVKIYKEYLENNKEDSNIYNRIVACKLVLKDETALEFIKAGLKAENQSAVKELKYHEVIYYETMQEFETARDKAKEYLAEYPEDEQMQKEYEFLQTR